MIKRGIRWGVCALAAFSALMMTVGYPQKAAKKITFEQAYQNKEPLLLKQTAAPSWLNDQNYLLRERDKKTGTTRLMKVSAETGEKTLYLDYGEVEKGLPKGFDASRHVEESPDYSRLIYNSRNDLHLYLPKTGQLRQLTATPSEEQNPRFSPDTKRLAYTRDNDLYVLDLDSGLEHQITADGSQTVYNGWASWVYYEEILGRSSRYAAFWWSPDSLKIAFLRFDDNPVPKFYLIRSSGAHGELETQRYPKPGDPNPRVKLGIATLPENKIVWADFDEAADHYVAWPVWLPAGDRLTVQWMNRGQDDIKIYTVDLETGTKEEIYDEQQPSWVGFFEDLYFFENGSGFLLRSDVDGWRHLYRYDFTGKLKTRLTQGPWQVSSIELVDEKNGWVYFSANASETTAADLCRVRLDGRGFERLTKEPGSHRTRVSPGGSYFIDAHSSAASPSRQDLYRTDGTFVRNIDQAATPELAEYRLGRKELFTIPTDDGLELPAYWILPPDFDQTKKYPVLFQIYGGPGSSTVSDTYPQLTQFYLAQEGIIVVSVDHRGSSDFGKKGTALMHRNLGRWEMHDLIEAVKWLRRKPFVDPARVGVTGGSYGGYTTCLALTLGADYFTHGIASSSVTDWRLYDSVYTERYMDTPAENKEGYDFGSVMTHAGRLKGVLLLEHGDMDDNVHMQNTIQLVNTLMDRGKMFELMIYPNQRHGFREAKREDANRRAVDFWLKHLLGR